MVARRAVLGGIAVGLVATALFFAIRTRRDFVDFEVYRTAAVRVLAAEPLYRPEDGHYQFKYWPVFALALTPLAALPPEAAKLTWFLLSIGLIWHYVGHAIRTLPDRRRTTRWLVAWILLVTAKFIVKELVNGQTNVLLGVLALSAAFAADRRQPVRAGLLVAAAACVKPYALLLLPWMAVTTGGAPVVVALGAMAVGLVLPAVFYGWTGNLTLVLQWYATVSETTLPNLLFPENISFAAMWAKWLGAGSIASMLAIGSGLAGVGLAAFVYGRRSAVSRPVYLEAGVLLLLMPLISPQGWDYVLLLAVPAFVCLLDRLREEPPAWRAVTVAGFALTSLTIFDLLGRARYMALMDLSVVSVGAVLLLASLVHLRIRERA